MGKVGAALCRGVADNAFLRQDVDLVLREAQQTAQFLIVVLT